MPLRNGRMTFMEQKFVKAQLRLGDPQAAAWRVGYQSPHSAASKLMHNPRIQQALRLETQRFLFEEAGGIAVAVLADIAIDPKMPAGARVKSATELAKLSNIAISDELAGKPDHEMTAMELDALRRRLEAQRQAVESVLASIPATAIDSDVLA